MIEDGVSGYLREPGSLPRLRKQCSIGDADRGAAFGDEDNARQRAEEQFGAERVSDAYISVLTELVTYAS